MRYKEVTLIALLLAPSMAHAHGEAALYFPIGHLVALAALLICAKRLRLGLKVKLAAVGISLATAYPFWVLPLNFLPPFMNHSAWSNFILGVLVFLPPGLLVQYFWHRYRARSAA
jgi:hypothetical protein